MPKPNTPRKTVCAATAMLLACGSAAGMAPTAFAAETGTIKISSAEGNQSKSYKAYQIFSAEVNAEGVATNIEWSSPQMKTAVSAFIADQDDAEEDIDYTIALMAAEYIKAHITGTTSTTVLDNSSFGFKLAKTVANVNTPSPTPMTAGTVATFNEGYVLVVSNMSGTDADKVGTAPVFATINHDVAVEIDEKTTVPEVEKTVDGVEENTASIGEDLAFKLTGTVSSNYDAYESYKYRFVDTVSDGIDIVKAGDALAKGDFTVKVDGTATTSFTVVATADGFSLGWDNTKAQTGGEPAIEAGSTITVEYKGRLNGDAVVGAAGNPNEVHIEYSRDPMTTDAGKSTPDDTKTYTYSLILNKLDKNTADAIEGAKFTIKEDGDDGKYIKADGTLSTTAYEFTTDADGKITLEKGLALGTYKLHESAAPDNFKALTGDLTLDVAIVDDALSVTITGGLDGTSVKSITQSTGLIEINVTNEKTFMLPLTGLDGNMIIVLAGALIIAGCLVSIVAPNKKEKNKI